RGDPAANQKDLVPQSRRNCAPMAHPGRRIETAANDMRADNVYSKSSTVNSRENGSGMAL
ncbi:MAG TPA: hypothetical protein VFS61_14285, partial [Anaerolineales bacterium]|nr:hypothetical protein [Anaerolineales bacterium]